MHTHRRKIQPGMFAVFQTVNKLIYISTAVLSVVLKMKSNHLLLQIKHTFLEMDVAGEGRGH